MGISAPQARDAVRHRIQDGQPSDASQPFEAVRLEELTDQIGVPPPATPVQTVFQLRYADVPTGRYATVQAIPHSLVAYVDGSWAPTAPTVDVDQNGNFTLPVPPLSRLLVTYAWQYLADSDIDSYVNQARQWLREFSDLSLVPDGLQHALVSYASSLALKALARRMTLANIRAGDSGSDWSDLAKQYSADAKASMAEALQERSDYYTQGPEAHDPTAVDVASVIIRPYTPER